MTADALLLIGRDGTLARDTLCTHATRLEDRGVVDECHVLTYVEEPDRELRERLRRRSADRTFVLPVGLAHSRETTDVLPPAVHAVAGAVDYCEPIGRSPTLTRLVAQRAAAVTAPAADATLVLVAQGSSSQPYHRQVVDYHAARLEAGTAYGAVNTCYLLQNPTVECARYAVSTERAVAVPLFVTRNETTERRIPEKLELDRGGIAYADPFGEHPLVTDAIQDEIARQRILDESDAPASFEDALVEQATPVAADGTGPRQD
jgi:sirohydrochlorin ferrochelatase